MNNAENNIPRLTSGSDSSERKKNKCCKQNNNWIASSNYKSESTFPHTS